MKMPLHGNNNLVLTVRTSLRRVSRKRLRTQEARFVSCLRDPIEFSLPEWAGGNTVVAKQGGTVVLASCSVSKKMDMHFGGGGAALKVDYVENSEAAGRIPRTFTRREFKTRDNDLLVSRFIDRSIRPLFPSKFPFETQIVCRVKSYDGQNDPEILALNASSAALGISGIPWKNPFGAIRMSFVKSLHDTTSQTSSPSLVDGLSIQDQMSHRTLMNLIVTSTRPDEFVMLELGASEISEKTVLEALKYAGNAAVEIVNRQNHLFKTVQAPLIPVPRFEWESTMDKLRALAKNSCFEFAEQMVRTPNVTKQARSKAQTYYWYHAKKSLKQEAASLGIDVHPTVENEVLHDTLQDAIRICAMDEQNTARPDGRGLDDIRAIEARAEVLPVAHGSALFSRGNTQVLCHATLGPLRMRKSSPPVLDDKPDRKFLLTYNFPPYSVNRTGLVFGLNRRMVGHGALAEKALLPLVAPIIEGSDPTFPFMININSEVTGSDGSSSMATVCGASLAMKDACIPLPRLAAGISVGLHVDPQDSSNFVLPVDILGMEDHFGGMDFKVAGTEKGLTAVQLDIKRPFVTFQMIEQGLEKAKFARSKVLKTMVSQNEFLFQTGHESSKVAVLPVSAKIPLKVPESQRKVFLASSRAVQEHIESSTGATLEIEFHQDFIRVFGPNQETLNHAVQEVEKLILI